MMYSNRLAVAIKVNGKVLREFKDTVYLPFGSEYSLLIKNVHSLRCLVRVSIDGQDVTEGVSLIVPANSSVELERFIKNGNPNSGNRLKFIERTVKVEEHRGIGIEDGLVRIEYEFEREPAPIKFNNNPDYLWPKITTADWNSKQPQVGPSFITAVGRGTYGDVTGTYSDSAGTYANTSWTYDSSPATGSASISANSAGITVPGSVSSQPFTISSGFLTDGVKHVMVLKLLGEAGAQPVKQAVTVKTTQKCSTCGHVNKASAKFCQECGTGLVLV